MKYRKLGKSGLLVSEIGLGGNNFGLWVDEPTSVAIIHHALDTGINYIDTADVYGHTNSERFVGQAIKGKRSQVIVATKFGLSPVEGRRVKGGSRRYVMRAVEGSLKRLQTDYIDLYQMHLPDATTPIEETLSTLDELVRSGKVRHIGCSNFASWQLCDALWTSKVNDLPSFVSVQVRYNLLERQIETELVPCCKHFRISVIPWGPLAGGFLTGKYRHGEPPPTDGRLSQPSRVMRLYDGIFSEENWRKLVDLEAFAKDRGHTVAELAVAWLLAKPWIGTVIAGARTKEQVSTNTRAARWKLTAAEVSELESIIQTA